MIFEVDSEITFNFRSPHILLDDGEKEEIGKRKKRRYTDEEDAAILVYLDSIIKPSKRSKKKCSKIVETEEVF